MPGKGQNTGARPKTCDCPQTHGNRNEDTEVTECMKEESSEHYKTRRNVTTRGKNSTLLWKGTWEKESCEGLRVLDASMHTHPPGDDITLSISSHSGNDSDTMPESKGFLLYR